MQRVSNYSSFTYNVRFDGKIIETTVTSEARTVSSWLAEMFRRHGSKETVVVGLDCEWRPNYNPNWANKAATLQLCIDTNCLIIQLLYLDFIPQSLCDFLEGGNVRFVGVEVDRDLMKLRDEYGLFCDGGVDIRVVAKNRWPGRFRWPGLKDLAYEVAGLALDKPPHVTVSSWDARNLSVEQVEYACIDAYASYKIGSILLLD